MSRYRPVPVTWTERHTIEDEDASGETVDVAVEVTLAYRDVGIGPYEFWGSLCRDERFEVELLECVRADSGAPYELGEGDADRIVEAATERRAWEQD